VTSACLDREGESRYLKAVERTLYPALLLVWLAVFSAEAVGLARQSSRLARASETTTDLHARLDHQARRMREAVDQSRHASEDLAFLQELPALLPQDKGYLRTQNAVAQEVKGLRQKLAPRLRNQLYVVIDAKANKLYLKRGFKLLWEADCSVGRGGVLLDKKTGRRWEFVTPRGEFKVIGKAKDPQWRKPDWAYVETGEAPPPPDDPTRLVTGELGAFVLNLGDGILIHGTKREELLGKPASHGCVRLGAKDLEDLYAKAPVGTRVFIFY
jgi:L,D-transpeptidase ErfK/SrfK